MAGPITVRFLQISDVHLGHSLAASRLGYGPDKARQRQQEVFDAFLAALRLVESERCDGVLLPGDLFDGDQVDDALAASAFAAIGALSPRPVFLAPGNHDPHCPGSPYDDARWSLLARGEGLPPNLMIFREESFRTVAWPGRDDVTVTGAAYLRPTPVRERRLARPIVDPADLSSERINLALLHGSRDDAGFLEAHKATLPFTASELAAQPFAYVAVGHYHVSSAIRDPLTQEIRGGYSGMPAFWEQDEEGEKSALIVEVSLSGLQGGVVDRPEAGAFRAPRVRVERRRVDPRRLHRVRIDLTGRADLEQARAAVLEAITAADIAPPDVVVLLFEGRLAPELTRDALIAAAPEWLVGRCWHVATSWGHVEPELDLSPYLEGEPRTIEARFARELLALAERHPPDSRERGVVMGALYYGVEALVHGRIRRRWEGDAT